MTKPGAVAKNFHKIIKVAAARAAFRNACGRYVDKWLASRSFSRFFFRVTPASQNRTLFQVEPVAMRFSHMLTSLDASQRRRKQNDRACPVEVRCVKYGTPGFAQQLNNRGAGQEKKKGPDEAGPLTNNFFSQLHSSVSLVRQLTWRAWRSDA
jgi:hypothetical protein